MSTITTTKTTKKRARCENLATDCDQIDRVPSNVETPVKRAKTSNERGCDFDLLAALEHQKRVHLKLMHRALQYRAAVGLYKRKMQKYHESLTDAETTAFRAMSNVRQTGNWKVDAKKLTSF